VTDLPVTPSRRFVASLLLEPDGDAPFETELLVRSLIRNAGIAVGDVVIHCGSDLDPELTAPLIRDGCTVSVFEQGADRSIGSGVLRQLAALAQLVLHDVAGAWLFSPGTAVTAALTTPSQISGKLLDDATLAPEFVERTFRAANVALPPSAPCDENRAYVIATQLDTGLLYVPRALLAELCATWRRFAPFVTAIPELAAAADPDQCIEELSLALALAAVGAPIAHLTANDSFALDARSWPRSYDAHEPIRAVRYRRRLDRFGLVSSFLHDPNVDGAVDTLNALGSEPSDGPYFALYKQARAGTELPALGHENALAVAGARWVRAFAKIPRLVLHAGTPKTGTTALQQALFRHGDALIEHGIWYPPMRVDPVKKKHHYLVQFLGSADAGALAQAFDEIVASAPPETRTIVLSAEGLFNGWWDYPPEGKALLRHLGTIFELEMWTCFREPLDFALSQYAQLLRNPRLYSPAYGLDIGLEQILDIEWFVQRLDYLGFVFEVEAVIGAGSVRLFRYGPDIVERIFRALGAEAPSDNPPDVHPSLRRPGVEVMRIVNRYDLPHEPKAAAAALVLELDRLIGERAEPLRATPACAERIRRLTQRGWCEIEERLDRFPASSPQRMARRD